MLFRSTQNERSMTLSWIEWVSRASHWVNPVELSRVEPFIVIAFNLNRVKNLNSNRFIPDCYQQTCASILCSTPTDSIIEDRLHPKIRRKISPHWHRNSSLSNFTKSPILFPGDALLRCIVRRTKPQGICSETPHNFQIFAAKRLSTIVQLHNSSSKTSIWNTVHHQPFFIDRGSVLILILRLFPHFQI